MAEGDVARDILAEIEEDEKSRSGFGTQFLEGFNRTATAGWRAPDAPSDLPPGGEIGKFSGEMLGYIPLLETGPLSGTVTGVRSLLKELGKGALYGMVEKPEDAEADILSRMKNGVQEAASFGAGWGIVKGVSTAGKAIGKRMFGPSELDSLLAKGAEGKGPPREALMLEDQTARSDRFNMPDEFSSRAGKFDMPDESGFGGRKLLEGPKAIGGPEDLTRAMEMESSLGRETFGQKEIPRDPFAKTPMQEAALTRQRSLEVEQQIESSRMYEGHVNSWAKDILKQVPPEADFLEKAGKLAFAGNNEEATMSMLESSVKHAMGRTPSIDSIPLRENFPSEQAWSDAVVEQTVEELTPKIETRAALESNIEAIILKNEVPLPVVQAGTKMAEPINYWMSEGMNFDDAAELADNLVARARLPFEPGLIGKEMSEAAASPPAKIPPWESIKKRNFSPEEVVDLFYNVPIKGPAAIKHGLIELNTKTGGLALTEKGYAFAKQYNPDGLSGVFPPGMDRKIVGAIRGQGYSDINLSPEELKTAGIKMGSKRALQEGFIRPATKGGKEIPNQYQLESKGAGMLAGGKGHNANTALKSWDMASGLRTVPGDVEGIAAKSAERAKNELLFKDLWDQTNDLGKKC